MKILWFALAIIGVAVVPMAASWPVQHTKVEREARCIASRCATYSATIIALGPLQSNGTRTVRLRVDRVYAGSVSTGTELMRQYVAPSTNPYPERDIWEGVSAIAGQKILILEVCDSPVITAVELDKSAIADTIRSLTTLSRSAVEDPAALLQRIVALRPNIDALETNYVMSAAGRLPADKAVEALTTLMEKDGFAPRQRSALASQFTANWFQCTRSVQQRSIARLVRLAESPDFDKARPALATILLLRSSQVDVELPPITPAPAQHLKTNYEKLVAEGRKRDAAFEALLKRAIEARSP